jgi:hypothetical protein
VEKTPVGISRRRSVDNIKMDLSEIGCGINRIDLALHRDR